MIFYLFYEKKKKKMEFSDIPCPGAWVSEAVHLFLPEQRNMAGLHGLLSDLEIAALQIPGT